MLPDYWLPRPAMEIDSRTRADIDELFASLTSAGTNTWMDYRFPVPKWQFLCYMADQHGAILHGTGDPFIPVFEPRPSNDLNEFGAQTAVYAAGDGLWAMFFAVVDREHVEMATTNACIRLVNESGQVGEPHYLFSISRPALLQQPWRKGTVYVLPGDSFVNQPSLQFGPYEVRVPQLASLAPVRPLARLEVAPEDFPFLENIRGFDEARMEEYTLALQTGAPLPE